MAKGGKLTKLKSVLKKLNSFSKPQSASTCSITTTLPSTDHSSEELDNPANNYHQHGHHHHHRVFVGKSRRQYLISSEVLEHPLFQELVEYSGHDGVVVGCEVVMFEHLLWMIHNADPQPDSLHELVDFYASG